MLLSAESVYFLVKGGIAASYSHLLDTDGIGKILSFLMT